MPAVPRIAWAKPKRPKPRRCEFVVARMERSEIRDPALRLAPCGRRDEKTGKRHGSAGRDRRRRRQCGAVRGAVRARRGRAGDRARAGAVRGARRQFDLHGGRDPRRLQWRRRSRRARARSLRGREAHHRFRHLHRGPIFRRHGAGDPAPRRSRSRRAAGAQEPCDAEMAARQGRALRADLRPAGLQGRRQVQILGRAHGRGLRRRPGPRRSAAQGGGARGHRGALRGPRGRLAGG